jgi:hypothetical protein
MQNAQQIQQKLQTNVTGLKSPSIYITPCKEKVKLFVTAKATRVWAETGGIAILIHLTTVLDEVVSFTPWLHQPRIKSPPVFKTE